MVAERYKDLKFDTISPKKGIGRSSLHYYDYLDIDEIEYLENVYPDYDRIIATKYYIDDEEDFKNIKGSDIKINGIEWRLVDDNNSDYDIKTGNVHPSIKSISDRKSNSYQQIVLASDKNKNHYGPNNKDVVLKLEDLKRFRKFYYPFIGKSDEKDEKLTSILKKIFEEISK